MSDPKPLFPPTAVKPEPPASSGSVVPAPAFVSGTIASPPPLSPAFTPSAPKVAEIAPAFGVDKPAPAATLKGSKPKPALSDEEIERLMYEAPQDHSPRPADPTPPAKAPVWAPEPVAVMPAPANPVPPSRPPVAPAGPPAPVFAGDATLRDALMVVADEALRGEEDPKVQSEARRLALTLAKVPLSDTRTILGFGVDVQQKSADLPGKLLEMMQSAGGDILPRLASIRAQVASASPDDLFSAVSGVSGLLRRALAPPRDRLNAVIRQVELDASAVRTALPAITEHLTEIDVLVSEEQTARMSLSVHIRAGQIVLLHHQKRGVSDEDFGLRSLEEQIDSLRTTWVRSSTDHDQLLLMRENFAALIRAARSVTIDMVAAWKRVCVTAISLLGSPDIGTARAVGQTATQMREVSATLLSAIDAAITPRR